MNKLLGIIMLLLLAIIAFFSLPWLAIYIGIQLQPNPPQPEITYGEFPFRLEYEINGQRMVIQDTIICEYDGIGSDEGQGKYRKWNDRLASGNKRITLLKIDDTKEIYYTPGSADYYMDDYGDNVTYHHSFPNASIIQIDSEITHDRLISADELLNEYNIKLISWDYTQPIKNSFSTAKK